MYPIYELQFLKLSFFQPNAVSTVNIRKDTQRSAIRPFMTSQSHPNDSSGPLGWGIP